MDAARSVLPKEEEVPEDTPKDGSDLRNAISSTAATANVETVVKESDKANKRTLRKERVAAARAKGKMKPKTTQPSALKGTKVEKLAGFEPESFDAILLDPPCSALGLR